MSHSLMVPRVILRNRPVTKLLYQYFEENKTTKTVQRETTCTFTNTGNAEGVINPNYEVEVKAREGVLRHRRSGQSGELPCDGMDRLEQREYSVVRLAG